MLVNVQYHGKRLPWTISMPWLSVPEVTFGESREAAMAQADAERLCAENPGDWKIIGVIADEPKSLPSDEPARLPPKEKKPEKPKKPPQQKRKRSSKKRKTS